MSTDYRAEAAEHIENAVIANQNGQWETTRFEIKLAEVKALLALSEPPQDDIAQAVFVRRPVPLPSDAARAGRAASIAGRRPA